MNIQRRQCLGLAASAAAAFGFPTLASAQSAPAKYPSGPVRIIIPTPPGGALDALARLFGQNLSAKLGQPFVVESRAGANTAIAAQAVAKSPADGLTLLLTFSAVQLNTILQPKPVYRMSELAPITLTLLSPVAFAVNTSLVPVQNMREFIAFAKSKPGKLGYATYGAGSIANFMGEALNEAGGLDLVHVPYRGTAPALVDLIGGQVACAFGDIGSFAKEQQASGRVRVLGVNGTSRFKVYPNVATFSEQGLSQMDMPAWHALFAPAGTPQPIVSMLGEEMARIIASPDVNAKMYDLGFEPSGLRGQALEQYLQRTGAEVEKLFKSGRIKVE